MSANSERIIELFSQAKAKAPGEERAHFLAAACGNDPALLEQIESLLHAEEAAGGFLQHTRLVLTPGMVSEKIGDRIGPYKLLQKIGEGGMGTVWMAEQTEPLRRRVALKVIKQGMDSGQVLARFEAERQALALMDHPNIAKVLDAGATSANRPYFVMELVKGVPLAKFCDEQCLSIRERLELFVPVCQAIQHAHQKGIIHRDISPSNVLVALFDGRPVPKVIDFGIAKAIGQPLTERTLVTEFGAIIGKLEYMSPEQAEFNQLDIDTRSDIYSLGVLLYELLTGSTPLTHEALREAAFDEVLRRIREQEPPKPSTRLSQTRDGLASISAQRKLDPTHLAKLLRGDLDWIVMKALEKERNHRYETANGFGMDIQRFLANEPVVARPPSNLYRFQKMVRRNKLAFSAAGAVVAALVIGLSVAVWQSVERGKAFRRAVVAEIDQSIQRQRAETQARRAMAAETEAKSTLAASDFSQAIHLIEQDAANDALPYLVRSLRNNPTNDAASTRLTTLLTYRSWIFPTVTLKHDGQVLSAQFSPDGKRIVTTSADKTARVWGARTGQALAEPLQHGTNVTSAQFSSDGKRIVTVSADNTARVWDAETGQALTEPLPHGTNLTSAQFSPDGNRIVTASADKTVRVWDAQTGQALTEPLQHGTNLTSARFSLDGKRIVTISWDKTARVWDAQTGQPLTESLKYGTNVSSADYASWTSSVQFSPDGQRVVTASYNKTAQVWDALTGQPLTEPLQHGDSVNSAQFSPDGKRVVTTSRDQTVRVWDALTGQPLTEPLKHGHRLESAQFSPDSERIVTVTRDQTVRVWDVQTGQPLTEPLKHGKSVLSAQLSSDGKRIVTVSRDQPACVWDVRPQQSLSQSFQHHANVTLAQFSPDGKRIVTVTWGQPAHVWDAQTGRPLAEFSQHNGRIASAQFSPDGKRIVTASMDKTARVWDSQSGQPLLEPLKHGSLVSSAEFSPDGKRIVTASWDQTARVWDAETGQPLTEPLKHPGFVGFAQFSPDGKRIVTASHDPLARIWDVQTGQLLAAPWKYGELVQSLQFSRDWNRVVTVSLDQTVRVWDAQTGQPLTEPLKHDWAISSARFSPDGKRIVTASGDHTARVWDARTGQPLTDPLQHADAVSSAQFSSDGKRVITASADQTARIWDIGPTNAAIPDWLIELSEAISGQVLNKEGVLEPTKLNRAEILQQIRQKLNQEPGGDDWVIWGRWFLADPSMRTVSPFSKVK